MPWTVLAPALLLASFSTFPFFNLVLRRYKESESSKSIELLIAAGEVLSSLGTGIFLIKHFLGIESILDNQPLRELLIKNLDFQGIFCSDILLEMIATDMKNGHEVIFNNKDNISCRSLVEAILASSRLSGRFPQPKIRNAILGDGGILGYAPIHRAVFHKCDVIFLFLYTPFEETYFTPPANWMDDMTRSAEITEMKLTRMVIEQYQRERVKNSSLPELFIIRSRKKVKPINIKEFNKEDLAEAMNTGYEAIVDNLNQIRTLL